VRRIEIRLKEALHMGFCKCILPKRNLKGLSSHIEKNMELIGVDLVDHAIQRVLA